jgi:glyoxylase-like metal-dependent hydrolase (beta-lactamase superfamily II)
MLRRIGSVDVNVKQAAAFGHRPTAIPERLLNPFESQLAYPWAEVPATGSVLTLRPGLHWLRMPLPFALDHINLWLLDDEVDGRAGFTAIDCGITSEPTMAAWERLFDGFFAGRPLLRVICTHFHPDHVGLAHWLTTGGKQHRWRAPLWMTAAEYGYARFICAGADQTGGEAAMKHFRRNGVTDPDMLAKVRARGGGHYTRLVPAVPPSYVRINDGDVIAIGARRFRVIVGHGHSVEHASLYCEEDRLLISGDMVLPRISTNVAVFDLEPEADPLPRYLRSLDRYLPLPADTLVLPSHGKPFTGLHTRIMQQHQHHAARLAEVLAACAQPRSAAQIVPLLFPRELDLHQLTFALGEALAHLHALWHEGKLTRQRGADEVYRFVAAR